MKRLGQWVIKTGGRGHEGEEDLGGGESLGWTLKCQTIKIGKFNEIKIKSGGYRRPGKYLNFSTQ